MAEPRRCPLCHAVLRDSNPGPFCCSTECVRAQFALQAFLASEYKGALTTVQIDALRRDAHGIYTVWCAYPEMRRGGMVKLEGVRFNPDGVGMGQHVQLGMETARS